MLFTTRKIELIRFKLAVTSTFSCNQIELDNLCFTIVGCVVVDGIFVTFKRV